MENNFLITNDLSLEKTSDFYMTFKLSGKTYAIHAELIIEIVQLPALNILEKIPEYVVGVMNLRGQIISVIDLKKFLGIPQAMYSTEHQVLIVRNQNRVFGIITDSVNDVIQINRQYLEPLPYKSSEKFISGIYKNSGNLVAFLDLNTIVKNINNIETDNIDFKTPTHCPIDLFPNDSISQEKFKKRAINLEKELKFDSEITNNQEDRFVSFSLNSEIYCISLRYVKEFCKLKLVNLTPIPCVPEFVIGIINLRGEFITIIDIKSFLHISKTKITDRTKIIVVKSTNMQVGLIVDDVFDIVDIPSEKINLFKIK